MPEDLADTWGALLKVHAALVPRLDRELQETHGLPLTWYDVLLELNAAPERRLTMGQLGSVAAVSRTRVSRVVDELVRAGLVAREPNPDDGRSAFAALTPAGRAALRKAAPTYVAAVQREFADHLTAREAEVLAGALRKVLAAGAPRAVTRSRGLASAQQRPGPAPVTLRAEVLDALHLLLELVVIALRRPGDRRGMVLEVVLGHDLAHGVEEPVGHHGQAGWMTTLRARLSAAFLNTS